MSSVLFSHSYFYQMDSKQWETGTPYPPLGTIYAASFLRENGYKVSLFDVGLKESTQEIKGLLETKKPDYFVLYDDGFNYLTKMCLTNMREAAFEMIKLAKKQGCKVIVSSSDSTDHFTKYLEKGADIVILGEGEITLLEVLKTIDNNENLDTVKGVCFTKGEKIINKGRREVLKDLDFLPQAAWDLIDVESYKNAWKSKLHPFALNIATTRGCPYKCNWCAKPIYGNRYNTRSPKRVVEEIEFLSRTYNVNNFWMCDDIFGLKPNWVQEFDNELKHAGLEISYKIQSRADLLLKENNIDSLVSSGLKEVWIGAESGSQGILDAMDKGTTIKQIEDSTKLLQQKGVRVAFFIQYGYLGEKKEDIDKTISLIKRLKPDDIGISVSYPLPGTKFYDIVKDELEGKQNWTDSDELALLFKGTFNQKFYKKLHRFTHKTFQVTKGKVAIKSFFKNPFGVSKSQMKQIVKMPIYYLLSKKEKLDLHKMENLH